jgi:uncharacterized protein (TIGR00661 family)
MKFLFAIQGEGRGHLTQAISLQNMLLNHGHEVCAVVVGKPQKRELPPFFFEQIKCGITAIESPSLETKKDNKSMSLSKTLLKNFSKFGFYWGNVKKIKALVDKHQPDTVINFYDFLCGVYFLYFNPPIKHICIAHQFLLEHPNFKFPNKATWSDKFFFFNNSWITSSRFTKKLCLSFKEMPNVASQKLVVVPPLLRQQVLEIETQTGEYLLAYVVNAGFLDDIIAWHKNNASIKIHLFTDKKGMEDETIYNETLTIHKLNDQKFLQKMKDCKAYASTAGFESICEAFFMGKPVLLVPPQGHFEQQCNATDAVLAGAGIENPNFDFDKLMGYISDEHDPKSNQNFRNWVNKAEIYFLKELLS